MLPLAAVASAYTNADSNNSPFGKARWIGAITRADARLPEGRMYEGGKLRTPENRAAWAAVDTLSARSIDLRYAFDLPADKTPVKATANICGLGHYEFKLNGAKVGNSEFAPLWSDYDRTVYYNQYDITEALRAGGENHIEVLLGNGFYNVQGGGRYRKLQIAFGPPTLLMAVCLEFADGSADTIRTDETWKYRLSPITFNSIYGGEDYDARLEDADDDWRPVVVQEPPGGVLRRQTASPVAILERYDVTQRIGNLLDMGQNLAGFPEITVKGRRGQQLRLWVAERLNDDGTLNQKQSGSPYYFTYTLKGEGWETWRPRFSYYGFRYIRLEGAVIQGEKNPHRLPVVRRIQSCFVSNAAETVGSFECSNPLFNRIHRLIDRAVRSNMQAVFTDCPHREKLGWLEELHLNGPSLFFNYDLRTLAPKIVQDMADAQSKVDGSVPSIAPQYVVFEGKGMDNFRESPEWGVSLLALPFLYYEHYGDDGLIRTYYPNMRRYVDYLTSRATGHIVSFGLGDWYDYVAGERAGFSKNTPVPLVATAHYYLALDYLVRAARLVGNQYDAHCYAALQAEVGQAFNRAFFHADSLSYGTGSQCSNALPLFLGLVPEADREGVLAHLVRDIRAHGTRLTTGDVGNRYLFQVLARNGLNDLLYEMMNHHDVPGYGFQLDRGATTLTEQWDPREGASWNHFMMGQLDEWLVCDLAGIRPDPDRPGCYLVAPRPCKGIDWVRASHVTPQGTLEVYWHRDADGRVVLEVNAPKGLAVKVCEPSSD
ncbi:MAG: glycoside hydrolase family 78 protein [Prevotellaceae bacterium]|jgi:hypothetical protein|nr:glycoside hydrolase family 78 protein [Prevotellaceae bacterium]